MSMRATEGGAINPDWVLSRTTERELRLSLLHLVRRGEGLGAHPGFAGDILFSFVEQFDCCVFPCFVLFAAVCCIG